MTGTNETRGSIRADHGKRLDLTGPDGVLAALLVSAVVAGGAAYVALDYISAPFQTASAPAITTAPPALAGRSIPGPSRSALPVIEPVALPPRADLATAPSAATTLFDPQVAVVFGPPVLTPPVRPSTDGFRLAVAPLPRPDRPSPAVASPLLVARSLVPQTRPTGFAQLATRVAATNSDVAVTRAVAPETEIATARVELTAVTPSRQAGNPCTRRLARAIPRRPRTAATGSELMAGLGGIGGTARDARLLSAAAAGNVPDFLRILQPVNFAGTGPGGQQVEITICVTPDYLSVGSDRDFVRVPLGLTAALQAADAFDMMLPTPRMVDAIYAQADLRLSPQPMTPGAQMTSTNYFLRHDGMVDTQIANAGGRLGQLVAGQKKDVVLANRLSSNPGRIAIYGWHRSSGRPIQPLSTVHGTNYADYSHGIRLISRTAFLNGRATDLGALLTDARYAGLLNAGGPITGRAVQLAALQ